MTAGDLDPQYLRPRGGPSRPEPGPPRTHLRRRAAPRTAFFSAAARASLRMRARCPAPAEHAPRAAHPACRGSQPKRALGMRTDAPRPGGGSLQGPGVAPARRGRDSRAVTPRRSRVSGRLSGPVESRAGGTGRLEGCPPELPPRLVTNRPGNARQRGHYVRLRVREGA